MSFASQISNRNFLSPGGFRFVLAKFPKVAYFAQSANVPSLELGLVGQPTPMRTINLDGMMTFGQFTSTFIVDEDIRNKSPRFEFARICDANRVTAEGRSLSH